MLQPFNRISLGVRFNFGDQGRQELSDKVDGLYLQGLDAYSRGNREEARYYWAEALKLDPRFDPAREGLDIITRAENVENRIKEMQQLDL